MAGWRSRGGSGGTGTTRSRCGATRIQCAVGRFVVFHLRIKTTAVRTHSVPAGAVFGGAVGISRSRSLTGTNTSRAVPILCAGTYGIAGGINDA